MISGATVTMPRPSDRNQTRQMLSRGASVWKTSMAMAPPTAAATAADRRYQKAQHAIAGRRALNSSPNQRSINQAAISASAALQRPEDTEAPKVPVAHQIGGNRCHHDADRDRCGAAAQGNEDAGGDARGRPEHGHALELGQKVKAEPRRQIVGDGDGEPDRAMPQISRMA